MVYVCEVPWQTEADPEIEPGVAGMAVVVTAIELALLVPQELVAVTETEPLLALGVTVIEFVVEEPVQPVGSVQV
jgi:hypothetical protein